MIPFHLGLMKLKSSTGFYTTSKAYHHLSSLTIEVAKKIIPFLDVLAVAESGLRSTTNQHTPTHTDRYHPQYIK